MAGSQARTVWSSLAENSRPSGLNASSPIMASWAGRSGPSTLPVATSHTQTR